MENEDLEPDDVTAAADAVLRYLGPIKLPKTLSPELKAAYLRRAR